jgi:hypothetical protein
MDRGKSTLSLPFEIDAAIRKLVETVTKEWCVQRASARKRGVPKKRASRPSNLNKKSLDQRCRVGIDASGLSEGQRRHACEAATDHARREAEHLGNDRKEITSTTPISRRRC